MTVPIRKAIIPAAGLGTRLLPLTKSQPKEMLPVGRKPVIQHVVEELQAASLQQILIVTGSRKRAIEDHFDADPRLISDLQQVGNDAVLADLSFLADDCRFFYTRQSAPRGLGHAVLLGADFADGKDVVVALGDTLVAAADPAAPLRAMIQAHHELGAAAVVAVERVPSEETFRYGIVRLDDAEPPAGRPVQVRELVEKPPAGTAPSQLAIAARYVLSPTIFEALAQTSPDHRGEIQLTDAIQLLVRMEQPVYAWPLPPAVRRYDVGRFDTYFRAFVDFALADERYGALFRQYISSGP
jgi:UTP--glucose-1-phosphate uridylyltransferase